jgi:hypothetical protein
MNIIKSRLQNGFLKVTIKDKVYFAWFPFWVTIESKYREDLKKLDKAVIIVEDKNGLSRKLEVKNYSLIDRWLENKNDKECRTELIKAVQKLF